MRTDELDDLGLRDEVACKAIGATENALVRIRTEMNLIDGQCAKHWKIIICNFGHDINI